MDFENRLRNHLAEQANGLPVEGVGASSIMEHNPRGRAPLATMAALVMLLAGGAGFWWLASGDDDPITNIAAGEGDETADDDTSGDGEGEGDTNPDGQGSAIAGPFVELEAVDISGDNSPGGGQVVTDNGIYYVLSTSPGRVDINQNFSNEEWNDLYRSDTFYVYDGDGWTTSEIDDRFVSDFDARDGILYAVSTGSPTSDTAALGTSTDQGRSWDWNEIDDVPEIDSLRLLLNDEGAVMFASRWGYPDYQQVIRAANDGGVYVTDNSLYDFDGTGFRYLPIDEGDPCGAVKAMTLPEVKGFTEWLNEDTEESIEPELEYQSMIEWVRDEFDRAGCPWDDRLDSLQTASEVDFEELEPVWVTWADIGFTPPETWKSWSDTIVYNGSGFTSTGVPFGDDLEFSYATTEGDQLVVTAYTRQGDDRYEGGHSETIFRTGNGLDWTEEVIDWTNYDDEEAGPGFYGPGYTVPVAGPYEYRLWWDESFYEEEATTATTVLVNEDGEEVLFEEVWEEPAPMLQRRTNGGTWETIDPTGLAEFDLGSKRLNEVIGTPNGVMLTFGSNHYPGESGESGESGVVVLYSNNGAQWGVLEFAGDQLDTWSHRPTAGDEQLVFAQEWPNEAPYRTTSQVYLVRPAG